MDGRVRDTVEDPTLVHSGDVDQSRRSPLSLPVEGVAGGMVPLTERILMRLPGPPALWIGLWAVVPWLNAAANLALGGDRTSAVWEQSDLLVVLNYAFLSLAVVITLWGTARIARRLRTLHTEAPNLAAAQRSASSAINSVAIPLAAAFATSLIFAALALERDGWASALLRGGSWLVLGVAYWTFLWAYVCVQFELARLGREHLLADAPRVDPSLGLRPLGSAAFMGLWMLLVWLVPVLLTGLPDVAGVVLGLLVLGGSLGLFISSLLRLHRQMVEVKRRELATARDLYAQAYEPVRRSPTLETLQRQQPSLSAAEALEKRATAIHEWPIDQATLAWVITITTSVCAMSIGRLILDPLGL
jgi:hypothetical protein